MSFAPSSSGGEYKHKQTYEELAKHNHANHVTVTYNGNAGYYRTLFATNSPEWTSEDWANATTQSGGNKPFNIVQPYQVVYRWIRIT